MADTPAVSVRYDIGVLNIVLLVCNIQHGVVLSLQVLRPSFSFSSIDYYYSMSILWIKKEIDADFRILTNLAIYLSLSTYRVLVLPRLQCGSTILIRAGLCILLRCT